jgi:hypothetical protein
MFFFEIIEPFALSRPHLLSGRIEGRDLGRIPLVVAAAALQR